MAANPTFIPSWRTSRDHHDNWAVTAQVIDELKDLAPNAGPYRWNDPDFLMVRFDLRWQSYPAMIWGLVLFLDWWRGL